MVDSSRQAGAASARKRAVLSSINISRGMICAAAQILEASAFCEMSPTIAEVLAEEILTTALSVGHDRQKST